MKILDNINERLKDDLIQEIKPQSKLGIAAAYFSIYAYQELKKQYDDQLQQLSKERNALNSRSESGKGSQNDITKRIIMS